MHLLLWPSTDKPQQVCRGFSTSSDLVVARVAFTLHYSAFVHARQRPMAASAAQRKLTRRSEANVKIQLVYAHVPAVKYLLIAVHLRTYLREFFSQKTTECTVQHTKGCAVAHNLVRDTCSRSSYR